MSEKKYSETNPGVACDVSNCKYNTIDYKCNASKISVQNERASTRARLIVLPSVPEALALIKSAMHRSAVHYLHKCVLNMVNLIWGKDVIGGIYLYDIKSRL